MRNLSRNKQPIYLCKKTIETINEREREVFSEPVEYLVDYQPISTDGEIIAFGNDYINRLVIYTTREIASNFNNADRCYVYVEKPETHDRMCNTADFVVDGKPMIFLNEARIYLQRMTGDDE